MMCLFAPVVNTAQKDKSVKLTLDSRNLNKAFHKNNYQMQSVDHLFNAVAFHISEDNSRGHTGFPKLI